MVLGLSNPLVSLFFVLVLRSDDNGTHFFFVFLSLLGEPLLLRFLHSISNQQVKAEQERAEKKSTKRAMVEDEDQRTHLVGLSMKAISQFASDPALSCDLPTIWATQYLMAAGWCAKACSGPLGGRSGLQYSFSPISWAFTDKLTQARGICVETLEDEIEHQAWVIGRTIHLLVTELIVNVVSSFCVSANISAHLRCMHNIASLHRLRTCWKQDRR
jgi:hypothetical protein